MEATLQRRAFRLPTGEQCVITDADLAAGVPQLIEMDTLVRRVDGRDERVRVKYYYVVRDSEVAHFAAWRETLPPNSAGLRELAWDTETDSLWPRGGHVATEQMGNPLVEDARVYVADVRCLSRAALNQFLAPVNDPSYLKIGQNIAFEIKWGMHHFDLRPKSLYCTQVTELVLRAGLFEGGQGGKGTGGDDGGNRRAYGATSMAKLMKRYCGPFEIDKDTELRMSFYSTPPGTHAPRQIVYAAGDCVYPFYIREGQLKEVEARALRSVLQIEYALIPVLVEMELRGMAFDSEGWIKLWQDAVVRHELAEQRLDRLFLAIEPDLFAGTDAAASPRKVCDVCTGDGERVVGEGWRKKKIECDQCSGTGRIGGGIRPIYTGGTGTKTRPKPLNWGSSPQVKWAIRQYCAKTGWRHELITTEGQLLKAKRLFGGPWLVKRGVIKFDQEGKANATVDELADDVVDDVPDYVVPEETHCILLSTDADILTLRMLRDQLPREFCEALLSYAEEKAKLGTFGRKFLAHVGEDGRFRAEFHQAIAATGRLSTSPNSQNIPRDPAYRHCFRAAPGKRLCIADYSQQEPSIMAELSGDSVYVANYQAGDDLYVSITEEMLGYRPDVHAEDKEFREKSKKDRQAIKSTTLGLGFRMGPGKLRDKLTLDTMEPWAFFDAADLHKGYLAKCAGIAAYQEAAFAAADPDNEAAIRIWDVMADAAVTFIESPCGRKRFFLPDAKAVYTEAPNFPIQSCGASMSKAAMVLVHREIERRGWVGRAYLVNAIHDELVMEADEDIAAECAAMLKAMMEKAASYYVRSIPLKASFPTEDGTAHVWVKE